MKLTSGLLKPLFSAIARLPLIGPHGEEVALLQAGAKPTGFFAASAPEIALLQDDVAAGRLIQCAVPRLLKQDHLLLCWPGTDLGDVAQTQTYLSQRSAEKGMLDPRANASFRRLQDGEFAAAGILPKRDQLSLTEKFVLSALELLPESLKKRHFIGARIQNFLARRNTQEFLRGDRQALIVPHFMQGQAFSEANWKYCQELIAGKAIKSSVAECQINAPMVIFGQPGQEENMAKLATILREYDKPNNERSLPPETEGQLLGYSDADIDFWLHGQQRRAEWGPVRSFLMENTNSIRRDIRVAMMKEAGPEWTRNP